MNTNKVFKKGNKFYIKIEPKIYKCKKCGFQTENLTEFYITGRSEKINGQTFEYLKCAKCSEEIGQISHYGGMELYNSKVQIKRKQK